MGAFKGFSDGFFEFMMKLKVNNSTEYFNTVRDDYEAFVKAPLYALCGDMEDFMRGVNPAYELRPMRCVSRIRRDTRFSRDKSPYRTNMWVAWWNRGAQEKAFEFGFFFDVGIDGCALGAGFFGEPRAFMQRLRPMLVQTPSRFLPALDAAREGGFTLNGDAYKRLSIPDGLDPRLMDMYIRKGFWFSRDGGTSMMMDPALPEMLAEHYRALIPVEQAMRLPDGEQA